MNLTVFPLTHDTKDVILSYQIPTTHKRHDFTITGRPVGYYSKAEKGFRGMSREQRERVRHYYQYTALVRTFAAQAGIETPLRCTKGSTVLVFTTAYFENGVHCDPENVRKGIVDALFYTPKGSPLRKGSSDKYCYGAFDAPLYDADKPRVEVVIFQEEK